MKIQLNQHLEDYVRYLQSREVQPSGHHHLLIACMPKSGSTWLRTVLCGLNDLQWLSPVNGWDRREHELSEMLLLLFHRQSYVTQLHLRYSLPTAELMRKFALKPIV